MVGGAGLGLDLAEELERLAPFGMGNPGVRLLVPAARVRDVRTMGRRASTPASASTAAPTGRSASPSAAPARRRRGGRGRRRRAARGQPLERLGRAAGGAARALSRARRLCELPRGGVVDAVRAGAGGCRCEAESGDPGAGEERPREILAGSLSAAATIAELVSSGAEVLVVGADAARRPGLAGLARSAGRHYACERCGGLVVAGQRSPAVVDYGTLERSPSWRAGSTTSSSSTRRRSARQERSRAPVDGWSEAGGYPHPSPGARREAASLRARRARRAARPAAGADRALPRPARGRRGRAARSCSRRCAAAGLQARAARRPRPAASASSPSSGSCRASRKGGRGRRGRILRGDGSGALGGVPRLRRPPSGGPAIPRTTQTEPRARRAPRRSLRRGRGVRLGLRRSTARRSRAPSTSPATATPTSCAAPATSSSPTRSGSPRSAPGCGSTPRRSARPCCTTRSRTPAPAWRRSGPSSARRSPSWSTA